MSPLYLFIHLSFCQRPIFTFLSIYICRSIYISIYQSIYIFINLSICVSFELFIYTCMSMYVFILMYVTLFYLFVRLRVNWLTCVVLCVYV